MEPSPRPARSLTITPKDAAAVMGCSESHVRRMIQAGHMPGRRIGRLYRIHEATFYTWLRGQNAPAAKSPSSNWL